jgi:SSS family solute:Na+ symporter
MSTIATQLNWGTSYLVEDFYRRFVKRGATERHYVVASQIVTLLLVAATGYVSAQLSSIRSGWQVVLQIGAGTGSVYMLRWFWWRINAWSEIAAMATSLAISAAFEWKGLWTHLVGREGAFSGSSTVVFAKTALATTVVTTGVWVAVTLLTQPESERILLSFYRKVRPQVTGWRPIARLAPEVEETRGAGRDLWRWALGCGMVYSALFGVGKLLLQQPGLGIVLLILSGLCAWQMQRELRLEK